MTTKTLPTICAIMVTYADRAALCSKVAGRLTDMGVSRIIIVDNASQESSRNMLQILNQKNPNLQVITNIENLGSGGAFCQALKIATSGEEDFIFLLDDDNLPHADCLKQLINAHRLLENGHDGILLYANRGSTRETDMRTFCTGFTKSYLPNSFCSFTLKQRVLRRFVRGFSRDTHNLINYPVVRVHYGPYGGMFGRREIFEKAGLPRDDYYLYADDHDYAARMDKMGISQFLIEPAKIEDLDISFYPGYFLLSDKVSPLRVYYQIRNHTHLSQSFIDSKLCYTINKYSFLLWEGVKGWKAWVKDPRGTLGRWKMLRQAIADGEMGRLGRSFSA